MRDPSPSYRRRTLPALQLSLLVLRRPITSSALSTSPRPTLRNFRGFDLKCFTASKRAATRRCCTSVHGSGAGQARDNHYPAPDARPATSYASAGTRSRPRSEYAAHPPVVTRTVESARIEDRL